MLKLYKGSQKTYIQELIKSNHQTVRKLMVTPYKTYVQELTTNGLQLIRIILGYGNNNNWNTSSKAIDSVLPSTTLGVEFLQNIDRSTYIDLETIQTFLTLFSYSIDTQEQYLEEFFLAFTRMVAYFEERQLINMFNLFEGINIFMQLEPTIKSFRDALYQRYGSQSAEYRLILQKQEEELLAFRADAVVTFYLAWRKSEFRFKFSLAFALLVARALVESAQNLNQTNERKVIQLLNSEQFLNSLNRVLMNYSGVLQAKEMVHDETDIKPIMLHILDENLKRDQLRDQLRVQQEQMSLRLNLRNRQMRLDQEISRNLYYNNELRRMETQRQYMSMIWRNKGNDRHSS